MNNIKNIFPVILLMMVTACASLPTDYRKTGSYALTDTDQTTLGKKAAKLLAGNTDQSMIYLLDEGTDAFFARLLLLAQAERSIDLQYFIWHADLIGKLLFNEVIKAADRGVRVRLLLDDINIDEETENILYAMDQHENIDVYLFNPFANRNMRVFDYISDAARVNRRMHNKSFTVDNQVTIVGGRNIGSEYFSANQESNFVDIDAIAVGPVVAKIEKEFDTYWNSRVVVPLKAFVSGQTQPEALAQLRKELAEFEQARLDSPYAMDVKDSKIYKLWKNTSTIAKSLKTFRGDVHVIYDDPEKGMGKSSEDVVYLKSLLSPHFEKATKSLELISPYFVPGDDGTKYLTDRVKKGIKVRVITNSLSSTDGVLAQSGYARHRIELLKGGVELYELKANTKTEASRSLRRSAKAKSGLHAKIYILDRKEIFIGSFNFDQRSANINSEVGIVYQIPEMAQMFGKAVFDTELDELAYRVELIVKHEKDEDGFDEVTESVVWIETRDGKEYRYEKDPDTGGWRRFNEDFFSILPIESQL